MHIVNFLRFIFLNIIVFLLFYKFDFYFFGGKL